MIVLDFETASGADLRKVGSRRYAEDPSTEILCACFTGAGTGEVLTWLPSHGHDSKLYRLASSSIWFISFGDFERDIWAQIMVKRHGFPPLPNERWHDIQAAAAMKQMPKEADALAQALGLREKKDRAGSLFTRSLGKPRKDGTYDRSPEAIARVVAYCQSDVRLEEEQHARLGLLPPKERAAWLQNQRVNQRGILLDQRYIAQCQRIVDEASGPLLQEFADLTGGLRPTQGEKFKAWLAAQGVPLPNLTKETLIEILGENDEDVDRELDEVTGPGLGAGGIALEKNADMPPLVRRALRIRQLTGSASIKKLGAMRACSGMDGRARGLFQYHGTGPGRSSGRLLQPQNFPKPSVKIGDKIAPMDVVAAALFTGDHLFVEELVGPALPVVIGGLRHALIAAPGHIFLAGDYAGIQARLVLALSGQHDKVAIMAAGKDVYCDMAAAIYGRPIDKEKDPRERGVGKNTVLGLGFEMGAVKFQLKYARKEPLEFAERCVNAYRKEWAPKVPALWRGLGGAATRAVWTGEPQEAYGIIYRFEGEWLTATVPSGSKIWYYDPRRFVEYKSWDEDEKKWVPDADNPVRSWTYKAQKMNQWQVIYPFGGLLTENVIMRMEADIVQAAQLKLEANGFPVVLDEHDGLVVEPLLEDADEKAFFEIMLDVEPWVRQLKVPMAVEGWQGERYRK